MLITMHKEIEKILYPFDPVGFYILLPFILILLFLFT
jgi:hypothetical protein